MNNISNTISGANYKMAPLISFLSIFDFDIGLIKLIYDSYLDTKVFDKSFFERPLIDIIKDLYFRKEENPLYLFSNNDKKELNLFYNQFCYRCKNEILDRVLTTDIINLISLFINNKEIQVSILYYSEKQKEIIDDQPELQKLNKIHISQIQKYDDYFSQVYLKHLWEINKFVENEFYDKTFYISDFGPNLNEAQDDFKKDDNLYELLKRRNHINIFNIYNSNIISKGE